MRKLITAAIPIITLALFICIMLSSGFLKKPLGEKDNIPETIEHLIWEVNQEAWDEADRDVEDLYQAWKTVVRRIQFSSERDELNKLSSSIARLRGAVQAKDKVISLMELYEAYDCFEELGN